MKRKYKCENCGFKFDSELEPRKCPYCDKDTCYVEMQDSDTLSDIDDFLK